MASAGARRRGFADSVSFLSRACALIGAQIWRRAASMVLACQGYAPSVDVSELLPLEDSFTTQGDVDLEAEMIATEEAERRGAGEQPPKAPAASAERAADHGDEAAANPAAAASAAAAACAAIAAAAAVSVGVLASVQRTDGESGLPVAHGSADCRPGA